MMGFIFMNFMVWSVNNHHIKEATDDVRMRRQLGGIHLKPYFDPTFHTVQHVIFSLGVILPKHFQNICKYN